MSKPVPLTICDNCGGTIWKQDNWYQCPDCGAVTTEYGGLFTHLGVVPDFKKAVDEAIAKEDRGRQDGLGNHPRN